jgi:hypothetical protein
MKKYIILLFMVSLIISFSGCDSCECGCEGDVNILNNTGISYSFEIRKGGSVLFQGTIMGTDDVWFGLEKGKFTLAYGEQNLNLEKNFSIEDCETTTIVLGN